MSKDVNQTLKDFKRAAGLMARDMGDTWRAWNALGQATMKDAALSRKQKELVALGISIHARCDYCIILHVRSALQAGATREEINDVCQVAILMGGGPSMTYVTEVYNAIDAVMEERQ